MQSVGFPLMLALSAPILITRPQMRPAEHRNFSLSAAKDHLRPLLIFAPNPTDPRLLNQLDLLARQDLLERQVMVVPVTFSGIAQSPSHYDASVFAVMNPTSSLGAYARFHIAATDFAVILIGKDGEEKLRAERPLTRKELNQQIDAMPMRQQEMQLHP